MRRQARRWKPATRETNRPLLGPLPPALLRRHARRRHRPRRRAALVRCHERNPRQRHRKRATTAIYAHIDNAALRDAAAQAASIIVQAMGYKAEPSPLPDEAEGGNTPAVPPEFPKSGLLTAPRDPRKPLWIRAGHENEPQPKHGPGDPPRNPIMERIRGGPAESSTGAATKGNSEPRKPRDPFWI